MRQKSESVPKFGALLLCAEMGEKRILSFCQNEMMKILVILWNGNFNALKMTEGGLLIIFAYAKKGVTNCKADERERDVKNACGTVKSNAEKCSAYFRGA